MPKSLWRDRNEQLDPETDYVEIVQNLSLYEFTWDITQSLSFALFRTYAVPSIGRLLFETGQFTEACQKRYDDTTLLLEAPFVHGFDSEQGRTAMRRINQMHKMYDISNDDLRYVLSTFVVVPKRWLDDYGWRSLTETELRATVNYYRTLGRHMNIKDVPDTYDGFLHLVDDYEREHFAYDEGGRRVADATLDLMCTFYPRPVRRPVEVFSRALMDEPLLRAFRYDAPHPSITRLSRAAMRARARLLRHTPSNRKPTFTADLPRIKSYPNGYALADLGTFPGERATSPGCPVPHRT
ncbi:oxygenase MpaB family protein [Nocardioides sambongensis]|uniref:oxygenase MpaB family protein n=1 Tax=Nocardioides sambongensis TaxID=2589074 RepID=UPI00112E228B|nr:oxygenase MpaB family protein [Nocardioides sambongensis]